eukprot:jgi/Tetstr1/463983/TSEL_008788.t1
MQLPGELILCIKTARGETARQTFPLRATAFLVPSRGFHVHFRAVRISGAPDEGFITDLNQMLIYDGLWGEPVPRDSAGARVVSVHLRTPAGLVNAKMFDWFPDSEDVFVVGFRYNNVTFLEEDSCFPDVARLREYVATQGACGVIQRLRKRKFIRIIRCLDSAGMPQEIKRELFRLVVGPSRREVPFTAAGRG